MWKTALEMSLQTLKTTVLPASKKKTRRFLSEKVMIYKQLDKNLRGKENIKTPNSGKPVVI